tara:strand:- start:3801 stop:4286 length:486 start_codon:yes stop_codon:yes gene_type:complete
MALELPSPIITLQIPLLYINNILALAIGPNHQFLRLGITLPILVLLASHSRYHDWSGEWGIHYALECLMLCCIWVYFDWNILGSPDREKWHKLDFAAQEKDGISKENEVPDGFWQRAWWGVRLATGVRYVGWSCQVKNVPVEVGPAYPRLYVDHSLLPLVD